MKDTRDKILDAASRVFGCDGVVGATTREIARAAKVNEVTLFRYFKSKNELLRCVVARNSLRYEDVFAGAAHKTPADLQRTVRAYATIYTRVLQEKEQFVRTLIGELNRRPKLYQKLFGDSVKPVRQKFINYLRDAQKSGLVRRGLDTATAADSLTGMLLAGVVRRPLTAADYDHDRYFKTCVDVFLKGIAP